MKIGLISDTHGNKEQMIRALDTLKETDCILHAGDFYRDALWLQSHYPGEVIPVTGNGDPEEAGPHERVLKIDGLSILLCHGHRHYLYRGLTHLYYHGLEKKADLVIFGHTHVPTFFDEGLVIVNPGSTSRMRSDFGNTCAQLHTSPTPEFIVTNIDTREIVMRKTFKTG